jgi:hypothetical protein
MEVYCKREGSHLVPSDAVWADDIAKLPADRQLRVSITVPRSVPHNRLYWSMIKSMVDSGANQSIDEIHAATKIKCGLYKAVTLPRGEQVIIPDSTAFNKLDQTAFNEFFDRAITFWKWCNLWDYVKPELRERTQ